MSNKLYFKSVSAKNFRSFGAIPIEIDLTKSRTLVHSSENGAGKSTGLTHALFYVLFDKAYGKGQKKTSLVNSKNGKDSLVSVKFDTRGSEWIVNRGQKPSVFQIYRDGVLVDNEAARGDMQAYLESIIGMDEKVFTTVVALGRDKFVPFNDMSASELRNFVEVMLDQGVFSSMNEITKEDIKQANRDATDASYEIGKIEMSIANTEKVMRVIQDSIGSKQANNDLLVSQARQEIDVINQKISTATDVMTSLQDKASKQSDVIATFPEELEQKTQKMGTMLTLLYGKKNTLQGERDRFLNMSTCPTCEQEVSDTRKADVSQKYNPQIKAIEDGVTKLDSQYKPLLNQKETLKDEVAKLQQINMQIGIANNGLAGLRAQIPAIERRIAQLSASKDISEEVAHFAKEQGLLEELKKKLEEKRAAEIEILNKKSNLNVLLTFLKDDGVKGEIAKIYLPVLNEKVNKYLDALNLWVNIVIDHEFNVSMTSPDRKNQTISDLSTGQARRIDLAMLLAWRDIAQLKSSVDTNLLIMDEVLENLSAQGVADFVEFIDNAYPNKSLNLFVITQRGEEFSEFFDETLHFSLKDDFSVMN